MSIELSLSFPRRLPKFSIFFPEFLGTNKTPPARSSLSPSSEGDWFVETPPILSRILGIEFPPHPKGIGLGKLSLSPPRVRGIKGEFFTEISVLVFITKEVLHTFVTKSTKSLSE